MRSTELHGERRGWNLHLVGRVVCFGRIFLEVWIFRNVWDEFQNSVTNHFTAATAKREDGVTHQEHAGTRLVLVAYFVDPRFLDQFSRNQGAIGLVKCFDVCVLQSHIPVSVPSFSPREHAALESNSSIKNGMRSWQPQVGALLRRGRCLRFYFQATLRHLRQAATLPKCKSGPCDEA
jgi:hypothetical protein